MKCLLVSDLHYALPQYDWTAEMAAHFDVVIIAGDHIDLSGHVDGRTQSLVLLKSLKRLAPKVRLIVSSGNHDLDARDADGEKITKWIHKLRPDGVAIDGDALTVGETLFTVCPWWDGPNTQREVAEQLARDAAKDKKQWIWVYHAPPKASPTSWTGDRDVGDAELVRWIGEYGPDIVLAGHIHESPFARGGSWVDRIGSTWVFNSGRQIGPTPAHIIFDTDRQVALWFSLAGAETVRLDQPLARPLAELTALPDWLR
jgi:Icc-related predicted phosphoesterase